MFKFLFRLYLRTVTLKPGWVLGTIFILAVAMAAGLPNLKLDASSESLTLENDRDLDFFRSTAKKFESGDFLVATYKPDAELFGDIALGHLKNFRDAISAVDGVVSVNSILDVPLLYSPKMPLTELVKEPNTLSRDGVDRELAKQEFLTSPIYKNLILDPEGQTTALLINLEVDDRYIDLVQQRNDMRAQRKRSSRWSEAQEREYQSLSQEFLAYRTLAEQRSRDRVAEIRDIAEQYRGNAEIYLGGLSMITADMIRFIRSDLVVFGVAVVLFMILTLSIIFRRTAFVVIPMLSCLTTLLLMLGYLAWVDWRLTVISSNFVALLLIISLAIIIHLVVRYREFLHEHPTWTQRALVSATIRAMARPCFYTVLTTIVAFSSLVVSDIRPVIDFGWMMTMGIIIALVLGFTLLPAALMLLPKPEISEESRRRTEKLPFTAFFSNIVEKRGIWILVGALCVAGLSSWGITLLKVENKFIDYFHDDTEIYKGLTVIDQKLGGTTNLDIIIKAPKQEVAVAQFTDEDDPFAEADPFDESDPFGKVEPLIESDPFADVDPFSESSASKLSYWMTVSGLRKLEKIQDYLSSLPEVGKVQSLAIFYKVGRDINGGLNDFELALMNKSLPDSVKNILISPYLSYESEEARISLRIIDTYPGLQRAELVERIDRQLRTEFKLENYRLTGLLVLYNNMLQSLFSSQILTLGVVFLGILIMFIILFRSLLVAIVSIIPNILAAAFILGTMGVAGLPLDMMTITVAAIAVGIGVDNNIHYIHRFKTELAKDGDYLGAMHRSHLSIGRALFYTSVIIVFGFSIMMFSKFIPTIYFGLLTGIAMVAALMGALLLLPKLLLLIKPFNIDVLQKEAEREEGERADVPQPRDKKKRKDKPMPMADAELK